MRTRSLVPALAIAALLVGCSSSAPTRLELSVTAGPGVEQRAAAVRLRVLGGRAPDATDYVETRPTADLGWPVEATIVPRGGDAARPIWIEVEALSATGETIARNARSAEFVRATTQIVRLHLADSADAPIDAPDASVATSGSRDGGTPAPDGGAPDGGACVGAVEPTSESCNALDDDCDGETDEDLSRRCDGRGCAQTCADGAWGRCVDRHGACDHDDDD